MQPLEQARHLRSFLCLVPFLEQLSSILQGMPSLMTQQRQPQRTRPKQHNKNQKVQIFSLLLLAMEQEQVMHKNDIDLLIANVQQIRKGYQKIQRKQNN